METLRRGTSALGLIAKNAVLAVLLLILVFPTIIILVVSFGDDSFIAFPPHTWGIKHYSSVFASDVWPSAFGRSLQVAALSAVVAVVIGTMFVVGLHRSSLPTHPALELLVLGPIIVPASAYAVATYTLYAKLHLVGTRQGLVLAHTILALPFVVLILGSAISRIPRELEHAAMSLGATRWRAYRDVTLRLLGAATVAAAIFAFIASFDEAVFVSFIGAGFTTLPLEIFNSLQFGVDPSITAIAAILTAGTAILVGVVALIRR